MRKRSDRAIRRCQPFAWNVSWFRANDFYPDALSFVFDQKVRADPGMGRLNSNAG